MSRNHVQKTIAQIKDDNMGRSDKPDLVTVRAIISHVVAGNFCYPACTLELNGKRCNKKVSGNGDGTWYSGRCNQSSEIHEYRYLHMTIKDHTGTTYTTAFQEAGEAIVGHTAQEPFVIRNVEQDNAKFIKIMEAVLWRKYLFKLRIIEETFNGEPCVRCNIVGVKKADALDTNHRLLEELNNFLKDASCCATLDGASVPNAGFDDLEAYQSVQTSNHGCGYGASVGGIGAGHGVC